MDITIDVQQIFDIISSIKQKLLTNVELIDIYQGDNIKKGKKSVTLKLNYQALDRTLCDDEIESQITVVFDKLSKKLEAVRR